MIVRKERPHSGAQLGAPTPTGTGMATDSKRRQLADLNYGAAAGPGARTDPLRQGHWCDGRIMAAFPTLICTSPVRD